MKDISQNYLQIQGWMVSYLQLSSNELLTFALVYGFSQDGQSKFTGSLKYLCNWLNCSKPTARKALSGLVEKEFLIKKTEVVNEITFNTYKVNFPGVKILYGGGKESLPGGGKDSLPNKTNINNNNDNKTPSLENFKNYAIEKAELKNINLDIEKLELKYESWKANNWKDGNNNQIKNWKSKILNTIPYLKSDKKDTNLIDPKTPELNKTKFRDLDLNSIKNKPYFADVRLAQDIHYFHVKRHKHLNSITDELLNKTVEDYYYPTKRLVDKYTGPLVRKILGYVSHNGSSFDNSFVKKLSIDIKSFENSFQRINQEAQESSFGKKGMN